MAVITVTQSETFKVTEGAHVVRVTAGATEGQFGVEEDTVEFSEVPGGQDITLMVDEDVAVDEDGVTSRATAAPNPTASFAVDEDAPGTSTVGGITSIVVEVGDDVAIDESFDPLFDRAVIVDEDAAIDETPTVDVGEEILLIVDEDAAIDEASLSDVGVSDVRAVGDQFRIRGPLVGGTTNETPSEEGESPAPPVDAEVVVAMNRGIVVGVDESVAVEEALEDLTPQTTIEVVVDESFQVDENTLAREYEYRGVFERAELVASNAFYALVEEPFALKTVRENEADVDLSAETVYAFLQVLWEDGDTDELGDSPRRVFGTMIVGFHFRTADFEGNPRRWVDRVADRFRRKIHEHRVDGVTQSVVFLTPTPDVLGNQGPHFRINLSIPFQADDNPRF